MRKLAAGECDATLLSLAGLRRIARRRPIASILSTDEMLRRWRRGDRHRVPCRRHCHPPAPGTAQRRRCGKHHRRRAALLAALDGSCRTPIAALLRDPRPARSRWRAMVISPDGKLCHRGRAASAIGDAVSARGDAGAELRSPRRAGFFHHRVGSRHEMTRVGTSRIGVSPIENGPTRTWAYR